MDPHVEQHQSYGLDGWTAKSAYAAHQLWRAKLSSGTDLSTDPRSGHKVDPPPQPPTSPKTRRRTTRLPHAKGSPSLPKDSRASAQHASSSTKNDGKAWADWMLEPKGVAQVVQSIGEALGCIALRPKAQPASAAQTARAEDAIRILQCCDLVLKRHAGPLIGGVVQLSLTGAGDDVLAEFVIDGKHERGVRRGRAPQADASITIDPSTFGALARCSSELTRTKLATACYFSGRLKVSGDLGLAADFYFLTDVVLRSGCSASCELGTEL